MKTDQTLWRRRSTYKQGMRQIPNPYFPKKEQGGSSRRFARILGTVFAVAIVASALYVVFFTNFFTVSLVSVQGNRYLKTHEVILETTRWLNTKMFGVFPRTQSVFVSSRALERHLEDVFGTQQAIKRLSVQRMLPIGILVSIEEKVPNLLYQNGGERYLVDRNGTIVRTVLSNDRIPDTFPKVVDQSTSTMTVGSNPMNDGVTNAIFLTQEQLPSIENLSIDVWYLPPVVCPENLFRKEEETTEDANINTNDQKNINSGSQVQESEESTNNNANTARKIVNENTNQDGEFPPCLIHEEMKNRHEIRIRTTETWEIYFRTDVSVEEQIQRLRSLLLAKKYDMKKLKYIDLRFGEQVIVK